MVTWQNHHLPFFQVTLLVSTLRLFSLPLRPSCRHKKQKTRSLFRRARISLREAVS